MPTRSRTGCSRRSSPAATRRTRGSSRRRLPASSARARRRFARRCAGSRRSGSSRSPRSGERGSAVRPDASCWRPTSCAPRSRRSPRGSPCRAWRDRDLGELAGYAEEMQAAARAGDSHAVAEADARFHGRIVEIADNGTLGKVWRSLEPFSRTYITLVVPGADPQWSADLHTPILQALLGARHRRGRRGARTTLRRRRCEHGSAPAGRNGGRGTHMIETLQLSEEFTCGPARLRVDVHGSEQLEHVLEDMNFLNYRLAEVHTRTSRHAARGRPRLASGRRAVGQLRRPADDVHRAVELRPDPEGHRHAARAPAGGARAAPVPRLGRALPRPDDPVHGRRVEPRQVDGPDRGLPARREARVHRDHRDRRDRAR